MARAMRAGGARVGTGEVEAAARALGVVGASPNDSYLAMRAVMCSRREDLAIFDMAFNTVFGADRIPLTDAPPPIPPGVELALPRTPFGEGPPATTGEEPEVKPAAWSDVELLLDKDFAEYTDAERALARVVVAQLARRGPTRRSRRLKAARTRGERPDLQRTLRASLRWGGEPLDRRWREPSRKPRKLVLVCDVSGSMSTYARVLLQYMHAAVATHHSRLTPAMSQSARNLASASSAFATASGASSPVDCTSRPRPARTFSLKIGVGERVRPS